MSSSQKQRLDLFVMRQFGFKSRTDAQKAIMSGLVYQGNRCLDKAGMQVSTDEPLRLKEAFQKQYVSRGGFKLKGVLDTLGIDVRHKVCLDVGISTGGFTDCLLQEGAAEVHGYDVGYGQLDWKLRSDPRVHLCERVNFRLLTREELYARHFRASVTVADVSFISATLMLPNICALMPDEASEVSSFFSSFPSWEERKRQIQETSPQLSLTLFSSDSASRIKALLIILIKPQFELERAEIGKGGIVRSSSSHTRAISRVAEATQKTGLKNVSVLPSAIKGGKGNQEFLLVSYAGEGFQYPQPDIVD